jgi:fructose-1,6-bisphosphatase I
MTDHNLVSLESHILREEALHPGSTGDFTWILSALSMAAKVIAAKVRRARLEDVLGAGGATNVHGETQQKLDLLANEVLMACLGDRPSLSVVASEEHEEPTILRLESDGGKYCVVFDPLDGSSNLDVCAGVGTIFSILRHEPGVVDPVAALCQPGMRQLAAGYILYGSSTVFVLTTGNGVDLFALDPSIGSFVLVTPKIRIPVRGRTYSVNEAYSLTFPEGIRRYLAWAHGHGYSSRYIGSMVADVHRTLLTGGVFLYPPTAQHPGGKLRLLYEGNPMAMIVEQAGGRAVAIDAEGRFGPLLEVSPTTIHQRISAVLGSPEEVATVVAHLQSPAE